MYPVERILAPRLAAWLAPVAIGLGLLVLLAAMIWRLPALSGMTLVVLGATAAVLERYRHTLLLKPMVVAHAATYGALYALFVAATCHSPTGGKQGIIEVADFTASLGFLIGSAMLLLSAWRSANQAV